MRPHMSISYYTFLSLLTLRNIDSSTYKQVNNSVDRIPARLRTLIDNNR